jgi:hypothetical protein
VLVTHAEWQDNLQYIKFVLHAVAVVELLLFYKTQWAAVLDLAGNLKIILEVEIIGLKFLNAC